MTLRDIGLSINTPGFVRLDWTDELRDPVQVSAGRDLMFSGYLRVKDYYSAVF